MEKTLTGLSLVHSRGVAVYARMLAIEENADSVVVRIASYFHDIAKDRVSFETYAEESARVFCEFAKKHPNSFSEKHVADIYHCIEAHVSAWIGNGIEPETKEAQIVSDADMIQQLSPFGLVKHMEKYAELPFGERLQMTWKDLKKASELLHTKTAKSIGRERFSFVEKFIREALSGF